MAKRRKLIQFSDKRLYYSIQEVADHFAVNVSLLRYWEKEFENIRPKKTAGGTRQYTKDDIQQIEIVYHLVKEKGMTIEGARQTLKSKKDDERKTCRSRYPSPGNSQRIGFYRRRIRNAASATEIFENSNRRLK